MDENKIEIIEYIMQLKISNFIKNNRNMESKQLAKKIEEIIKEKEEMYNMSESKLKEMLNK